MVKTIKISTQAWLTLEKRILANEIHNLTERRAQKLMGKKLYLYWFDYLECLVALLVTSKGSCLNFKISSLVCLVRKVSQVCLEVCQLLADQARHFKATCMVKLPFSPGCLHCHQGISLDYLPWKPSLNIPC